MAMDPNELRDELEQLIRRLDAGVINAHVREVAGWLALHVSNVAFEERWDIEPIPNGHQFTQRRPANTAEHLREGDLSDASSVLSAAARGQLLPNAVTRLRAVFQYLPDRAPTIEPLAPTVLEVATTPATAPSATSSGEPPSQTPMPPKVSEPEIRPAEPPAAAAIPAAPYSRLTVDATLRVITLDGTPHAVTEQQVRAVQKLVDARGGWVAASAMRAFADSAERPDRWIATLPDPLGAVIEGKRGAGFRLNLPLD